MANENLLAFKELSLEDADKSLWLFRKYPEQDRVKYTVKWINASDPLLDELVSIAQGYQDAYVEEIEYDLLSERTDNQFMSVACDQTHLDLLKEKVDGPRQENRANAIKDLQNIDGYVLRIEKDDCIVYCLKKCGSNWATKTIKTTINTYFKEADRELALVADESFRIERSFDVISFNNSVLIANKRAFESLLSYKRDFQATFARFIASPEFSELFTDIAPLQNFVGSNMIHLRRMVAIQDKGFFLDQDFMARLREKNAEDGWGINFSEHGKIAACEQTARKILHVLLDHRLKSELSLITYDVPATQAMA